MRLLMHRLSSQTTTEATAACARSGGHVRPFAVIWPRGELMPWRQYLERAWSLTPGRCAPATGVGPHGRGSAGGGRADDSGAPGLRAGFRRRQAGRRGRGHGGPRRRRQCGRAHRPGLPAAAGAAPGGAQRGAPGKLAHHMCTLPPCNLCQPQHPVENRFVTHGSCHVAWCTSAVDLVRSHAP